VSASALVTVGGLSWLVLAAALLITFGMSVLHSVVGFAFGLLSTPVFLLLFPPKQVVVLTVLLMLVLNALIITRGRHAVVLAELRALALPALVGLPVGAYILLVTSPPLLRLLVGTGLVLFAVPMLLGWGQRLTQWAGKPVVAGFAGGVLTTSINFNGPPVALYLVTRRLGVEAFRATTAAWLLFAHASAVVIFAATRFLTTDLLAVALLLSPACLAGSWVGFRLAGRIRTEVFQQLVLGLLVVMGILTITSSGYWR
jgi:uncharacterized membrane protein YfcA